MASRFPLWGARVLPQIFLSVISGQKLRCGELFWSESHAIRVIITISILVLIPQSTSHARRVAVTECLILVRFTS